MRKLTHKFSLSLACVIVASTVLSSLISTQPIYAEAISTTNEAIPSSTLNSTIENNSEDDVAVTGYTQVALLTRHSKNYTLNGQSKLLNQEVTEINGVTYIPLKAIAQIYGFEVSYNVKTRESIAASPQLTLAFKQNTADVKINNSTIKKIPKTVTIRNSLMVPVRAWSELTNTTLTLTKDVIALEWQIGPSAAFKVKNTTIRAKDTVVEYEDLASTPNGTAIVDEKWTGKLNVFMEPGEHTITRQVQDVNGVWSIPYTITVNVLPQNLPPTAMFKTNKDVYKLGEPITYTDLSTDDYKIKSIKWTNNKPVFFESGTQTVTIEVEDIYGLKSHYVKTITVSEEELYSKEAYYYNFTKQGDKITVEHALALNAESIPYRIAPIEDSTVVRLNSPEQISAAGIDYQDTIDAGKIRFALHKQNQTTTPYYMSLFAKNNNSYPIFITNDSFAMGGPSLYVNQAGKDATNKFFENIIKPMKNEIIEVLPGETVQILPESAQIDIQQNRTLSFFADYTTSGPLQFTSVISKSGTDALQNIETLAPLEHDNTHVRGTFKQADRKLYFNHVFGSYPLERIVIGDRTYDQYNSGIDALTGKDIMNSGNGGVKYAFSMEVNPNRIILVNARGGLYSGSLLVNNKLVYLPNNSYLANSTEAVVIYRTGDRKETVNINFIPAPGSNLPISIIVDEVPTIEVEEENKTLLNMTKK